MTVETTEPGFQLYTGNFLKGIVGKQGVAYGRHSALCMETQNYPDAINHVSVVVKDVLPLNLFFIHWRCDLLCVET